MRHVRGIVGWMMAFGLFVVVKLGVACNAEQRAKVKSAAEAVVECAAPSGAEAAELYTDCMAQPGAESKWCLAHASRPAIEFIECLWQKHLAHKCDKDCPFDRPTESDGSVD